MKKSQLVVVVVSLLLTGCGNGNRNKEPEKQESEKWTVKNDYDLGKSSGGVIMPADSLSQQIPIIIHRYICEDGHARLFGFLCWKKTDWEFWGRKVVFVKEENSQDDIFLPDLCGYPYYDPEWPDLSHYLVSEDKKSLYIVAQPHANSNGWIWNYHLFKFDCETLEMIFICAGAAIAATKEGFTIAVARLANADTARSTADEIWVMHDEYLDWNGYVTKVWQNEYNYSVMEERYSQGNHTLLKGFTELEKPYSKQKDNRIDVYIKYNQTVNGYEVTGRWRPFDEKAETGEMLLKFRNVKTDAEYIYESNLYHSFDTDKVTFDKDFKGHRNGDTLSFDYTRPETDDPFKEVNGNSPLGYYSPFQFLDIDFDEKDELLISDWCQGQAGNSYEVFKLTEKGLHRLDYEPLFRLTNIDRIDIKKKTITIVDFHGASDEATFYYSHKVRKDSITEVPDFYSDCTRNYSFDVYNFDLGVPFALDSIMERVERESNGELRASYRTEGGKIVRNSTNKVEIDNQRRVIRITH